MNWNEFLATWDKQFEEVKSILAYLNSYSDMLSEFKLGCLHTPQTIEAAQREWLWLLGKLHHPEERQVLMPHWVPINEMEYEEFIDLSHDGYPIFRLGHPGQWEQQLIAHSASDLLLACENKRCVKKLCDASFKRLSERFKHSV